MASNDGQRLTVFGLTYRQHDNRSMLRILREYGQLPENPGDRTGLFVALSSLAKELDDEKSEGIKTWLQSGGDFPSPNLADPEREFGRGPPSTTLSLDRGERVLPDPMNRLPYPGYPPNRGRGRGVFGRGRPRPFMGAPRFPHMPIPAFMGDFHPGYNAGPSSAAFMGVGRPLVESDALSPEFPTAYTPSEVEAGPSSINEDMTMGGIPDQGPLMERRIPIADVMEDMSLAEMQRQQRLNPLDSTMDEDENVRDFEDDWDSELDEDISDEDADIIQGAVRTRIQNILPGTRPVTFHGNPVNDHIHGAQQVPLVVPEELVPEGYIECCVCSEVLPPIQFPSSLRITSLCNHPDDSRVCLTCIEQTIRAPVDEGILNLVTCPLCPAKLSIEEIKLYASERIFARYQYLLMSLNPDMVFCLAPQCGHGQVHSPKELGPVMTCEKCSFMTCVHHKLPWHEGQTCDEFDCDESQVERLEQEEATAKLLASLSSKICPTCKQGVDRIEGCDHLRCRCGGEWCFDCMASWENILRLGMEAHAPTCNNHPRRVQMRADQKSLNEAKILESVHGGKVSDALQKARQERNIRNRERIRPLALEAAERRAKEEALARRAQEGEQGAAKKQRKARLLPAWEER